MSEQNARIRLLLVDDERDFLNSTSRALERRGFDVGTAADAKAALRLIEERGFDVVVLDVLMPGMPGDELFRRIKELRPGLPVIMLTGHGTVQQAFQISREGVFEYLGKPCEVDELARVARAAAGGAAAAPAQTAAGEAGEVRLLIVDDETELLESLGATLRRRGMRVATAASAAQALERLNDRLFDVVVLDVKMPGMDGIELLGRIKAAQPAAEVILLTGHPTAATGVQGIRGGAFDYLTKPYDTEELAGRIREACASARARHAEARKREVDDLLQGRPE